MDTTTDELSTDELRRDIEARRDDIGRDLYAIGDRVSPGRVAERTRNRASRRMASWKDRVMGSADQAASHIDATGASVTDRLDGLRPSELSDRVEHRVEGSPLGMGLVAFGFGFVLGSLVPGTSSERRAAEAIEPQLQQTAREAASTAREAADHLAPQAQEELDAVRDDAAHAAAEVSERGRDEARAAVDEVRGAANS